MHWVYSIAAMIVFTAAIFFTDMVRIDANDSVKTMLGLLLAGILFAESRIEELKRDINEIKNGSA